MGGRGRPIPRTRDRPLSDSSEVVASGDQPRCRPEPTVQPPYRNANRHHVSSGRGDYVAHGHVKPEVPLRGFSARGVPKSRGVTSHDFRNRAMNEWAWPWQEGSDDGIGNRSSKSGGSRGSDGSGGGGSDGSGGSVGSGSRVKSGTSIRSPMFFGEDIGSPIRSQRELVKKPAARGSEKKEQARQGRSWGNSGTSSSSSAATGSRSATFRDRLISQGRSQTETKRTVEKQLPLERESVTCYGGARAPRECDNACAWMPIENSAVVWLVIAVVVWLTYSYVFDPEPPCVTCGWSFF